MKTWFPKRLIPLKKNFILCIGVSSRTGVPSFEFLVMLIRNVEVISEGGSRTDKLCSSKAARK